MNFAGSPGLSETQSGTQSEATKLIIIELENKLFFCVLVIIILTLILFYLLYKQAKTKKQISTPNDEEIILIKSKCQLCNKETNGYDYCIDCFQKIQQSETETCKLCGEQYIKGTICKCVKSTSQTD